MCLSDRIAAALAGGQHESDPGACSIYSSASGVYISTMSNKNSVEIKASLPADLAVAVCELIRAYIDTAQTGADHDTKVVPGQGTHV